MSKSCLLISGNKSEEMKKDKKQFHSPTAKTCWEPYRTSTIKTSWERKESPTQTSDSQASKSNKYLPNIENCSKIDKINSCMKRNKHTFKGLTKSKNTERTLHSDQKFQRRIMKYTIRDYKMLELTAQKLRIDLSIWKDKTLSWRASWKLSMISNNKSKCHSILKSALQDKILRINT